MAAVNFSAVLANVYTAYLWPKSDGPRYLMGLGSSAGFCALCMAIAVVARFAFRRENRSRLRDNGTDIKLYVM